MLVVRSDPGSWEWLVAGGGCLAVQSSGDAGGAGAGG